MSARNQLPPLLSSLTDFLPPLQGLCGENVLLQTKTIPVRGHRQEWP